MPFNLRVLRHRWGIAAPRMTVRTHVAWYWRVLGGVAVLSVSIALALWIYDTGRRFAGFEAAASTEEVSALQARIVQLEQEAKALRSVSASGDSLVQIEKAAQAQLLKQIQALEADNARMREELAFFDRLAKGTGEDKVAVSRLRVENDAVPGEYRYRFLVSQGGRDREFNGRLQLVVTMLKGGQKLTLVLPDERAGDVAAYRVQFRRFYRVEGSFKVDPAATVRTVQVRVFEQGVAQPRATESFSFA